MKTKTKTALEPARTPSPLIASLVLGLACGGAPPGDSESSADDMTGETGNADDTGDADDEPPTAVDVTGEWHVGDPEELGLDPEALDRLRVYAMDPIMNTQALLVIRRGLIAGEWYAPDRDAGDWATSWSMAKSVSATLLGVAMHDGLLESLDEPMTRYIPEWAGSEREGITLRHVLSMSTGLKWGETEESYVDLLEMAVSPDQLAFAIDQEVERPPGETWNYSSGTSMLLSRVIHEVTGQQAMDYARVELAERLGFERYEWWLDGAGNTLTYCCIDATSRDFARLGQLYLQRGEWSGERLFAPEWVDEVTRPHQGANPSYGLQFWLNGQGGTQDRPSVPRTMYHAQGHDHQFVFVFPEQDMVVVRNARFIRPEGPAVAPEGLAEAGMGLQGLAPTGTFKPDESWDDTHLLELVMDAVVE